MEMSTGTGKSNRHDESMAYRARSFTCQRAMGKNSLPGYGLAGFVKRPVRTRMPDVVGGEGEKPCATDYAAFSSSLFSNTTTLQFE